MSKSREKIEIKNLLEAIYGKYGHDFRGYATQNIERRILKYKESHNINDTSEITRAILSSKAEFNELFALLTVPVSDMFRDWEIFLYFRQKILPRFKNQKHIKIWQAGCAMGEETYSLAIMLHEEGLLERCQIFSTDINDRALKKASKGIYNLRDMKKYTENYFAAGGLSEFSKYYHTKYKLAIMSEYLKSNILFIHHDMITEAIFGEMDIILCRNVLIYFTAKLQDRVLLSFHRSLAMGGVLWLGKTENLKYKPLLEKYKILGEKEKIYRKVKA